MRQFVLENFDKGLITKIEDRSIPESASSKSLNWLTQNDRIELSGGYKVVGSEIEGAGRVSGLHVGTKVDGSTQPFYCHGQKIKYFDSATSDWVEVGGADSNQLGVDADDEDITFASYVSLAGYQTWLSSPNSSLYKIMNANPSSIKDMFDDTKNFKGHIVAENNRLLLWFRDGFKNVLHGSFKDIQNTTTYTTVSSEAVGVSGSTNYTGNLGDVTGTRTCFNVVFTDGTQTIQDNKDGTFVGDGTGTINYSTGSYNITFDSITTGSVTSDYEYEDSTQGNGIANFTFSASRFATEGFILHQSVGGDLLNILPYKTDATTEYYCVHENNAWIYSMPNDDLSPTNFVFREKVGIQNFRAAIATGDGIYYIDTSDLSEPKLKLLTLARQNDKVEPVEVGFNVDLTDYDFSDGVAFESGDYLLFSCKSKSSTVNDRVFAYHKTYKTIDQLGYYTSCFSDNLGLLWAGDSLSNNVQELLIVGGSANGSVPENYWEGKLSQLTVNELKKCKRLSFEGLIQKDQEVEVYISYDGADFTLLGEINGGDDYVGSKSRTVGSSSVGSDEISGGGTGVQAFDYTAEFRLRSPKFDRVKLRFVATGIGYVSISNIDWFDIKTHGQKNLRKFRT